MVWYDTQNIFVLLLLLKLFVRIDFFVFSWIHSHRDVVRTAEVYPSLHHICLTTTTLLLKELACTFSFGGARSIGYILL